VCLGISSLCLIILRAHLTLIVSRPNDKIAISKVPLWDLRKSGIERESIAVCMSAPPSYEKLETNKGEVPPTAVIVEGEPSNGPIVVEASPASVRQDSPLYTAGDGYIAHKENTSLILFPIAGHPAFDNGSYYHPVGCCCYVEDRRTEQCNPGTFLCFPLTLACYISTCAYQPCGWGIGQIPWLGDCPCTRQRVTSSFVRSYPSWVNSVSRMVLVRKGSRSACVFANAQSMKTGRTQPLVLASHPGKAIGMAPSGKQFTGPYTYILSELVDLNEPNSHAAKVHYDGEFIWIANEDLVFDVAFWKYEQGNTVNFVGDATGTQKSGGGRSWDINDDGTISLRGQPQWVLGL